MSVLWCCIHPCHAGMLSKSKGQILRVAAVLHSLFNIQDPGNIPDVLSENAMIAANDFVSVCLQHTALISGGGLIEDAIKQAEAHMLVLHLTKRESV